MNLTLIIELIIIAAVVAAQIKVFLKNRMAIQAFSKTLPDPKQLQTALSPVSDHNPKSFTLLYNHSQYSPLFRDIVDRSNHLISKHQGKVNAQQLLELAERKLAIRERDIEANIALPLYLGLLGTFTGVIIGLIKISLVGVSDAAIQSFIGGVLIGMVASASGLALTVFCNLLLKATRRKKGEKLFEYLSFLQAYIVPVPDQEAKEDLARLRQNLTAFQLSFHEWQNHLNESLVDSMRVFDKMQTAFGQVRRVEDELEGMGRFLNANQRMVEKLFYSVETYAEKADELSDKLENHFEKVNRELETVPQPVVHHALPVKSNQAVLVSQLNGNGHHNGNGQGHRNGHTNGYHAGPEIPDKHIQATTTAPTIEPLMREQLKQMQHYQEESGRSSRRMNELLEELVQQQEKGFWNSKAVTIFIYSGVAAFGVAIIGRILQLFA